MRADTATGKVGGKSDREGGADEAEAASGKISRSKGGSTGASALAGLIERQGGERIRFFLLRTQYRSTIVFSEAAIEEAATGLETFYRLFERYERITGESFYNIEPIKQRSASTLDAADSELLAAVARHRDAYLTKMDDDFNTGGATAELFELSRLLNRFAEQQKLEDAAARNDTDLDQFRRGMAVTFICLMVTVIVVLGVAGESQRAQQSAEQQGSVAHGAFSGISKECYPITCLPVAPVTSPIENPCLQYRA
jgi:cysteinyl-tRNA synthetase